MLNSVNYNQIYKNKSITAEKARKELNGEVLEPKFTDNKIGRPVRICQYEGKTQVSEDKDVEKSLLVKNVDKSVTAKEFYKLFEEFGEIKSSKLEIDEFGVSKGYGYVYFNDAKSAEEAKAKLVK